MQLQDFVRKENIWDWVEAKTQKLWFEMSVNKDLKSGYCNILKSYSTLVSSEGQYLISEKTRLV